MQVKANEVVLLLNGKIETLADVKIIETEDCIYVEDSFKLGTSDAGEDLIQKRFTQYQRKDLLKIVWSEDALVESQKENILAELIQDKFEHLMDMYEEEEEDEEIIGTPKVDKRDDPNFDPYGKKEEKA